ncbi:MAG: hypothetical protein U1C53_00920, partial [Candidatus Veblenbacteria bacterium]|nr:hypothetical protein [Candidatus Veblenbacteria bacterium]
MGTENIRLPGEEAEQVPELPVEVKTISSYEPPRFEVQEGGMLIDGKAVSGIKVESLNPADLASSPDGGTIVLQQQRKEENNPWKVIRRDSSGAYAKQFELEQFMKDEFLRNGNVFGVTVNRPGEKSKENTYTVHLNEKEIGIGEDYPQFNERITGDVTQYQVVSRQNHDRRSIHFFDSANPEHEFPRCEVVGRGQGHGEFSVNGVQWHVPGEVDYSSGYRVLADKYSNDIALNTRARSGGKSAIVHNNKTWKHAFENAYGMRLEAGYLSLVDRHHDDKKLYINDNVWQMPDFEKK